jgi:hypothetical protein
VVHFELDSTLSDPAPTTTWLVTRYRDEIHKGDLAFIWQTGEPRGLRAVLRIDSDPHEMIELPHEQQYLKEPNTSLRVRVLGSFVDHFPLIPHTHLKSVPSLMGLSVFHGYQQATNFRVTSAEGATMMELIRARKS